jgi:rRNA processing protein Gar1
MERAGEVLHYAKSHMLIIKVRREIKENDTLYLKDGRNIGRIIEVFGPIASPYAAVRTTITDIVKGEELFSDKN